MTIPPGNTYDHLILYADGSIQPDQAGAGMIALDKWGGIVYVANRVLQPMTNNEAEYAGLVLALETAGCLKPNSPKSGWTVKWWCPR